MSSPTKSRRRTIAQGRALIAAWQASGLSARAFCQTRHLSPSRINFWKRRIRQVDKAETPPSSFIQVQPSASPQPPTANPISVSFPNGLVVTIPAGTDLLWLGTVLATMQRVEVPCLASGKSGR